MKVNNLSLWKAMYPCLLAMLFQFTFVSCSQDSTETQNQELTKLNVNIIGVADLVDETKATLKSSIAINKTPTSILPKIESHNGFDAIVELKNDDYRIPKSRIVSNTQVNKGNNAVKALAMTPGKQFRMLIYKMDGTLYANQLAVAGTPLTIDVVKGDTYRWITYSYNEDATITLPDISDPVNPSVSTGEGFDVLYASDNITIANSGNTPLGITFKHVLNRIAVELNTMGMFADLISASISFPGNYFNKGRLNLNDGAVSDEGSYSTSPTSSNFVQVPGYAYGDRNVAYFYTANPNAISSFQVNLNALTIKLDDNTNRTFTTTSTFNVASGIPASSLGKSRTVTIDLIESPLTVDGIAWSRANLYYQAGHNPYRFHHTYAHKNQRNSYFAFKSHLPDNFSVVNENIDPCHEVYPIGVWRHASAADYSNLVLKSRTTGSASGLGYVEYTATGTAAPYPSNRLRINFNGQGIAIDVLNLIGLNFGTTYGNSAHLWSNTEGANALISLGGWYYYGISLASSVNLELLNVGLLGTLNVIQTPFKNIRCVRN